MFLHTRAHARRLFVPLIIAETSADGCPSPPWWCEVASLPQSSRGGWSVHVCREISPKPDPRGAHLAVPASEPGVKTSTYARRFLFFPVSFFFLPPHVNGDEGSAERRYATLPPPPPLSDWKVMGLKETFSHHSPHLWFCVRATHSRALAGQSHTWLTSWRVFIPDKRKLTSACLHIVCLQLRWPEMAHADSDSDWQIWQCPSLCTCVCVCVGAVCVGVWGGGGGGGGGGGRWAGGRGGGYEALKPDFSAILIWNNLARYVQHYVMTIKL